MSNARRRRVAKCDLPSGAWVEYRENLKAKDRFAAQAAAIMSMGTDGDTKLSGLAIQNSIRNALLAQIITKWSYPVPVPAQNDFIKGREEEYLGEQMDLDDYNFLAQKIEPLVEKISGVVVENPKKPSNSSAQ
jgi:hypothetical protein